MRRLTSAFLPIISSVARHFNYENLLIRPNNLTSRARLQLSQKSFVSVQFCFTAADRVCLFWRVNVDIFRSSLTTRLRVLGYTSYVLANKLIELFGFLLIYRMHFIIYLDRCERGLPLLGRSDKSLLSLYRCAAFHTVDLAVERVFARTESDLSARCSAIIWLHFYLTFLNCLNFC